MAPPRSTSENSLSPALKRILLLFVGLWCLLVVVWANQTIARLQAEGRPDYPFGVFPAGHGRTCVQDFSYNMLYFEGIGHRLVEHPYRMADQEKLMRRILPFATSGMTHAYSPVALVLAQPLLALPGRERYLAYTVLCALGIVLLFHFCLLPRMESNGQFWALAICLTSVCVLLAFEVGQSVLITTTLMGFFWTLLRTRRLGSLRSDVALAVLFWALCLKPSVAILPAMLLLGARAWKPLLIGIALLLITWAFTANDYGGWWTGLRDYAYLLNHYNGDAMTTFMQRGLVSKTWGEMIDPRFPTHLFLVERALILAMSVGLVLLRWLHRIDASEHFQGMIGTFLLFSPYLLPSEDWILCLLVVEGPFFKTGSGPAIFAKLLILAGIMNLRSGLTFPIDVNYPLRAAFFGWMLVEFWRRRRVAPTR
jgi:hypothetical protein